MIPGARLSAAIALLDEIIAGEPAERALTRWARGSRFAGSKDRAAIRDLVFDGLRRRRSLGWLGGADTGRAIILAAEVEKGSDIDGLFTGERFCPDSVGPDEMPKPTDALASAPTAIRLDVPDFLLPELEVSLGGDLEEIMQAMQSRAPVDLRVNTLKTGIKASTVVLARDGIYVEPLPDAPNALRVVENPRLVKNSRAYSQGMVELQDLSSQLASDFAGAEPGMTVLDYCAGGGGKSLSLACSMHGEGRLMAWDAFPRRMTDLPARAGRAGATVEILTDKERAALGPVCDLVFVDAPCSGTGAWRRKPGGRWLLTEERLAEFPPLQDSILDAATAHVRPGGLICYATCSLLKCENEDRVKAFLARHPDWQSEGDRRFSPLDGGDGFYAARLRAPA